MLLLVSEWRTQLAATERNRRLVDRRTDRRLQNRRDRRTVRLPQLESWIAIHHSDEQLIELDRSRDFPRLTIIPATSNELFCSGLVLATSCLMAFSSGTLNITMNAGIILGSSAVAVGAFTIARRTIETLSSEISALPLAAAVVIAPVSAALVIVLAALGILVSFVIITTMCIAGIGWGRAIRRGKSVLPRTDTLVEADVECFRRGTSVGTETPWWSNEASEELLFDSATTARVVLVQRVVPTVAMFGSYVTFRLVPVFGL